MALVTIPLTTKNELQQEFGHDFVLQHSDHDSDNLSDSGVVDRAINRATKEILRTAGQRYSATGLASDEEMRAMATRLAGYFLAGTRAQSIPNELARDVEEWIRPQLADIRDGKSTLNGVSLKSDLRPVAINRTIDRRFRWQTVRKTPDSTGPPSVLKEHRADNPGGYD